MQTHVQTYSLPRKNRRKLKDKRGLNNSRKVTNSKKSSTSKDEIKRLFIAIWTEKRITSFTKRKNGNLLMRKSKLFKANFKIVKFL